MTKRYNRPTVPDDVGTLLEMLTWCRPHGTKADRQFRGQWIAPLGARDDGHGNLWVHVGTGSRVLWSCHTDTVHRVSGRQRVEYHAATGLVVLPDKSPSNCLGGDDTVGVWLCREMIAAGVPGAYVFHYGEESGGIGSRAAARLSPGRFANYDVAIALDRGGTGDVVTHQFGGRTCSDVAAWSIAGLLHDAGLRGYAPTHGVYTDTAEYADIIPECTNVSVGYGRQHSPAEFVNVTHARRLRDALIAADWGQVDTARLPGDSDFVDVWEEWREAPTGDRDVLSWQDSRWETEEEFEEHDPWFKG